LINLEADVQDSIDVRQAEHDREKGINQQRDRAHQNRINQEKNLQDVISAELDSREAAADKAKSDKDSDTDGEGESDGEGDKE